jgi:hypothetical protein
MERIEDYKKDKEQLLDIIKLINETRHCKLVSKQLLKHLDIEVKFDPNAYTCDELVNIIIFLHDTVIARDKMYENSVSFEHYYGGNLHVLHYDTKADVPIKDGVKPTYIHTLSKGFETKTDAEAMLNFLFTPAAMEEYGVKVAGFRTTGHHTQCQSELKVWLSSARWKNQNELIQLLGGKG